MKLLTFNLDNTRTRTIGAAKINFHKSGLISFSKKAVIVMDLQVADLIEITQEKDNPLNWYVYKTKNKAGFSVRARPDGDDGNRFIGSSFITNSLFESLKKSTTPPHFSSICCLIGSEVVHFDGKDLFPIITKSAVIRQPKDK
jgi:hypothetical protein